MGHVACTGNQNWTQEKKYLPFLPKSRSNRKVSKYSEEVFFKLNLVLLKCQIINKTPTVFLFSLAVCLSQFTNYTVHQIKINKLKEEIILHQNSELMICDMGRRKRKVLADSGPKTQVARRSRPFPSRNLCLFCLNKAPAESQLFSKPTLVGASNNCLLLQKQLQLFFVTRKILELPFYWCEKNLTISTIAGETGEAEDNQENVGSARIDDQHQGFHFDICDDCFKLVDDCWSLHQKLLSLQNLMEETKEKLKSKIVDSSEVQVRESHLRIRNPLTREMRKFCLGSIGKLDSETLFKDGALPIVLLDRFSETHHHFADNCDNDNPRSDAAAHLDLEGSDEDLVRVKVEQESDPFSENIDDEDPDWAFPEAEGYPSDDGIADEESDYNISDSEDNPPEAEKKKVAKRQKVTRRKKIWAAKKKCKDTDWTFPEADDDHGIADEDSDYNINEYDEDIPSRIIDPETEKKKLAARIRNDLRRQKLIRKKKGWPKKKYHKKPVFPCAICGCKFGVEAELADHHQAHETSKVNNGEFDCPTCRFPCLSAKNLEKHTFAEHVQRRKQIHHCKDCNFKTHLYFKLELHVMENHGDQGTSETAARSAASLEW